MAANVGDLTSITWLAAGSGSVMSTGYAQRPIPGDDLPVLEEYGEHRSVVVTLHRRREDDRTDAVGSELEAARGRHAPLAGPTRR